MGGKIGEEMWKVGKIGEYGKEGGVRGGVIGGGERGGKGYVNGEERVGEDLKGIGVERGGGGGIKGVGEGLMNGVENLGKRKGDSCKVWDDVMEVEREERELRKKGVEEEVLEDRGIRKEGECLGIEGG
ncbi:hypothetical protein [Bacillus thuringiensis]|uniref:hypothetical protein n=1 Tax=Bacillus thuringiensis TaxID=1428 RepID=UPI0011A9F724|nr:hypothetical protein [Bacillus thuringiensis]